MRSFLLYCLLQSLTLVQGEVQEMFVACPDFIDGFFCGYYNKFSPQTMHLPSNQTCKAWVQRSLNLIVPMIECADSSGDYISTDALNSAEQIVDSTLKTPCCAGPPTPRPTFSRPPTPSPSPAPILPPTLSPTPLPTPATTPDPTSIDVSQTTSGGGKPTSFDALVMSLALAAFGVLKMFS